MRKATIVALWLAVPLTAYAADFSSRPPAEYSSGPTIAPVEVYPLPLGEVNAMCRGHIVLDADYDNSQMIPGCVIFENKTGLISWNERSTATRCLIFYADDVIRPDELDSVLDHETAHCRGWPPDHPGEIRLDAEASTGGLVESSHVSASESAIPDSH